MQKFLFSYSKKPFYYCTLCLPKARDATFKFPLFGFVDLWIHSAIDFQVFGKSFNDTLLELVRSRPICIQTVRQDPVWWFIIKAHRNNLIGAIKTRFGGGKLKCTSSQDNRSRTTLHDSIHLGHKNPEYTLSSGIEFGPSRVINHL